MSTNQSKHGIWSNILRLLIFLVALYFAYRILKPLLIVLLGISFWIIKVIVFIAAALLVVHLSLKLIFGIDLLRNIGIRSWWNK